MYNYTEILKAWDGFPAKQLVDVIPEQNVLWILHYGEFEIMCLIIPSEH
jgi:hypothetical protein